jgi:hypothetical protein
MGATMKFPPGFVPDAPAQKFPDGFVPDAPTQRFPAGFVSDAARAPEPQPAQPGLMNDLATMGKEIVGDIASGLQRFQGVIQSNPSFPQQQESYAAADALNRKTDEIEQQAQIADATAGREFLGKSLRGAGRTAIPTVAAAFTGGAPAAIGYGVGLTGNQAITQAEDKGLAGGQKARYVTTQMLAEGVPSAVMGKLGWGGLESVFVEPAKRGLAAALKKAGLTIAQELPEEYATQAIQSASNYFEGVDPNALTPAAIESAFYDVGAQTFLAAGAGSGISSLSNRATPTPTPTTDTSGQPPINPAPAPPPPPPDGGFRVSSVEPPTAPVETPAPPVTPTPAPAPEVVPQATPEPISTPQEAAGTPLAHLPWNELTALSEQANLKGDTATLGAVLDEVRARKASKSSKPRVVPPQEAAVAPEPIPQPQQETPNGKEAANEAQGQRQAAEDVLNAPAGAAPTPAPAPSTLKEAWDTYNDSTDQMPEDLINTVEALVAEEKAPKSLQRHIDKYRAAVIEDMKDYGGRSGLNNEAEDKFMAAVQAMAEKKGKNESKTPASPSKKEASIDDALKSISEAATEADAYTALGARMSPDQPFPSPAQQKTLRDAVTKRLAELSSGKQEPPAPAPAPVQSVAPAAPKAATTPETRPAEASVPVAKQPWRTGYYHASSSSDIKDFHTNGSGGTYGGEVGTHFGTLEQAQKVLERRNGGRIYEASVDVKNPIRLEDNGHFSQSAVLLQLKKQGVISNQEWESHALGGKPYDVRDILESKGYDGIVYDNRAEGAGDSVVAFRPEQIKIKDAPATQPPSAPVDAPVRFKRTGKGDASVHEATIEGRAVTISKGKDGWETRLDGNVADVHPTLAEARGYATGELRQDLRDDRNAREEEGTEGREQPYTFTEKETAANALIRKAWGKGKSGEDLGLSSLEPEARVVSRKTYDKAMDSHADFTANDLERNASATWDINRSDDGNQVILTPKRGPAPADTGIFRDLTAAAREGKRFVEELHARIAPTLAKLYASAKSPVEFVRAAVAKIGEHVRPYAKRFAQEVKRGLRDETGARITGKGIKAGIAARLKGDRKPLANPGTTPEARGFVEGVDAERTPPDAQTREQWERAADTLDRGEVMKALKSNKLGGLGPEWTIAAKRITDEAAWNALHEGKNVSDAWHIADDYRRTGTSSARELAARYDPILSPVERETVAKAHKELSDLNTKMDDPDISDAEHTSLMDQYAKTQQRINDIKMVGTARRMLAEIFTSPRRKTDATLKKLDKVIEDRTISDEERARKKELRDKVSNEEGRALEVMRRRMVKSGVPLDDPVAMTKRDNILRALNEAKAHKSTMVDKFEELFKNLMFSGSTPLNVIDNAIIMGNEFIVNRPLEMALNKAFNIDPKAAGFDDASHMMAAIAPGLRRGIRNMIDSWRTEADMFELQTHGPNMNMSGKLEGRGAAITGRTGRAVRAMGYRPLMATDSFNKSVIAEIEVAAHANRLANIRGLTGRAKVRFMQRQTLDYSSESWQHAVSRAENLTLTDESGVVTKWMTEGRDKIWPLRFLVPVIKTPAKALAMTLRKTPAGTARIAYKMYRDPTYTRKALAHDAAEQAAAWAVALGLYAMFNPGDKDNPELPRITGNQPYSQKHYAENQNKAMVAPPRSIRFGDKWYGYGSLGVVGGQIATTVDLLNALGEAKDGDPLTALSNLMTHFMGNVRDQTYLGSINDIGQAFEEGGMPKWATNFAAAWSPSALKKLVRMSDSKERETRALNPLDKLAQKAVPLSSLAPAKVDLMGREISKSPEDGPRSDLLWRILPQSGVVDLADRDPVENNMYRMFINWNNQHPDKRWAPDAPQLHYKDGKEQKQWTPQEYHDMSVKAGQWSLSTIKKINERKPFNFDAPTEQDKAIIDEVLKSGREYAKGITLYEKAKSGSAGKR